MRAVRSRLFLAAAGVLIFSTCFLSAGTFPDQLVYTVMFSDTLTVQRAGSLAVYCRDLPSGYSRELPSHGQAKGVLMVFRYPAGPGRMQYTILNKDKARVFRNSLIEYTTSLSAGRLVRARAAERDDLEYLARFKVYGRFGTRFAYTMRGRVVKRPGILIERDRIKGAAERIQGLAGHLDHISYFNILIPLSGKETLRIVANWTGAGGDLPLVGRISAEPEHIIEGIRKGDRDIREYLKKNHPVR